MCWACAHAKHPELYALVAPLLGACASAGCYGLLFPLTHHTPWHSIVLSSTAGGCCGLLLHSHSTPPGIPLYCHQRRRVATACSSTHTAHPLTPRYTALLQDLRAVHKEGRGVQGQAGFNHRNVPRCGSNPPPRSAAHCVLGARPAGVLGRQVCVCVCVCVRARVCACACVCVCVCVCACGVEV